MRARDGRGEGAGASYDTVDISGRSVSSSLLPSFSAPSRSLAVGIFKYRPGGPGRDVYLIRRNNLFFARAGNAIPHQATSLRGSGLAVAPGVEETCSIAAFSLAASNDIPRALHRQHPLRPHRARHAVINARS